MEHFFRKQAQSNLGRWQQGGGRVTVRWQDAHPGLLTVTTRNGSQQWNHADAQELVTFLQAFLEQAWAVDIETDYRRWVRAEAQRLGMTED